MLSNNKSQEGGILGSDTSLNETILLNIQRYLVQRRETAGTTKQYLESLGPALGHNYPPAKIEDNLLRRSRTAVEIRNGQGDGLIVKQREYNLHASHSSVRQASIPRLSCKFIPKQQASAKKNEDKLQADYNQSKEPIHERFTCECVCDQHNPGSPLNFHKKVDFNLKRQGKNNLGEPSNPYSATLLDMKTSKSRDCKSMLKQAQISTSKLNQIMEGDRKSFFKEQISPNSSFPCEEEYTVAQTALEPEITLKNIGIENSDLIDFSHIDVPTKTNLYQELFRRITKSINPDCKVKIGDEVFQCHLLVLQVYSGFFDSCTDISYEISKEYVDLETFSTIYEWMISGENCHTIIKRGTVLSIFVAAQHLEIKELEEQCWALIDSETAFNEETAFLLYKEAKEKKLVEVMQLMIPRIRDFFLTLVSSQDFLNLNIEEVCVLLSSNYISVSCEIEVMMSAVRWMKYDWENRKGYLIDVMKCIRFGLIAPWQLVDLKKNHGNEEFLDIMCVPEITQMADDGIAFVIIKYYYGDQVENYKHWVETLGLVVPSERNWNGVSKTYLNYREFLQWLDSLRRQESIKQKNKSKNIVQLQNVPCEPPKELLHDMLDAVDTDLSKVKTFKTVVKHRP